MPDRGKVINHFEDALSKIKPVDWWVSVRKDFLSDTLVLLKVQEAKPMTEYDDGWDCPRCGLKLVGKTASGYLYNMLDLPSDEIVKYCPVCGQAVKWDG